MKREIVQQDLGLHEPLYVELLLQNVQSDPLHVGIPHFLEVLALLLDEVSDDFQLEVITRQVELVCQVVNEGRVNVDHVESVSFARVFLEFVQEPRNCSVFENLFFF